MKSKPRTARFFRKPLFWILSALTVCALVAGLLCLKILPDAELDSIKQQMGRLNQSIQNEALTVEESTQIIEEISQKSTFHSELSAQLTAYLQQEIKKIYPVLIIKNPNFANNFFIPRQNDFDPATYLESRFDHLTFLEKASTAEPAFSSPAQFIQERTENQRLIAEFSQIAYLDLDPYIKKIPSLTEDLAKVRQILTTFQQNPDLWQLEPDKIIVTKRATYQEIQNLFTNLPSITLIQDTTPPEITAINLRVPRGSTPGPLFACVDNVDDQIECQIDPQPDFSKIGNYEVKVSATDQAQNTATQTFTVIVYRSDTLPYYIKISKTHQVVMVYGLDAEGEYTSLVKTFVTSTGRTGNTPVGSFKMSRVGPLWGRLVGNVWGKYPIRITGPYWIHSVPYYQPDPSQLEWEEYNKLGSPASAGCVRLAISDVKWIYDNVPNGTTVEIYTGPLPDGVVKPTAQQLSADDSRRGWDPTDPDPANPWH